MTQPRRAGMAKLLGFLGREDAQDVFEYILIVGGLSVALVGAIVLMGPGVPGIVTAVCVLIDGLIGGAPFAC